MVKRNTSNRFAVVAWLGLAGGLSGCRGCDGGVGGAGEESTGEDAASDTEASVDPDAEETADEGTDSMGDAESGDSGDEGGVGSACEGEPPVLDGTPPTQARAGELYQYTATASDPEGDTVYYAVEADSVLSIHPTTGEMKWIPTGRDVGAVDVVLIATDRTGCTATREFTLTVEEENFPPEIVSTAPGTALVGGSYSYPVVVDDPEDDAITLELVDGPSGMSISGTSVQYTPPAVAVGIHRITLRATDEHGKTGSQTYSLVVGSGGSSAAPFVSIASPSSLAEVAGLATVSGSVQDSDLVGYFIDVCDDDGGGCVEVDRHEGTASGVLGRADTGVRDNGFARIRVRAVDTALNVGMASVRVQITGDLKLGHVEMSIVDMELPAPGMPLRAIRRFTSLRRNEDLSFGYGWELQLADGYDLQRSRVDGEGWSIQGSFLNGYWLADDGEPHFYTLRTPDKQLHGFAFFPDVSPTTGGQFVTPSYEDVLGTGASFAADDANGLYWILNGNTTIQDSSSGAVFNPQHFTMTTSQGWEYGLNLEEGLEQVSDPRGNTITMADNAIAHSAGRSIQIERSGGRITKLTDPAGNEVRYFYNEIGDLIRVDKPDDQVEEYHYRHGHLLYDVIGADGALLTRKEYDDSGRLIGVINGEGRGTSIEYDDDASEQRFVDEAGSATLTYDAKGNVVELSTETGATKSFVYDGDGNVTQEIDAEGLVRRFTVNGDGQITAVESPHPAGESAAWHTTTATYNANGHVQQVTAPSGAAVQYSYTPYGEISSMTDETGRVLSSATYRGDGSLLSDTTYAGTRSYQRNAQGDVTALDEGAHYDFDVDAAGRMTGVDYPGGVHGDLDVDAFGNLKGGSFSSGEHASMELTGGGQWKRYSMANGDTVERAFDPMGRVTRYTAANGGKKRYLYDDAGRLAAYVDEIGRVTESLYDGDGRLSEIILPDGSSSQYTYDDAGRMLSSEAPGGQTATWSYDAAGRVATTVDPMGRTTSLSYTPSTVTATDGLGRQTTTTFYAHGLAASIEFADGTQRQLEYLVTSEAQSGNEYPTLVQDEAGHQRELSYDGELQLATASNLAGNDYQFGYQGDHRASMTAPTGEVTQWEHASDGNLSATVHPEGGETRVTFGLGGEMATQTLPSGATIDYAYDKEGYVTEVSTSDGVEMTMAYDLAGRMSSMLDGSGDYEFEYDLIDHVRRIDGPDGSTIEYERNDAGQILAVEVTPSSAAAADRTEYGYNDKGQLVEVEDPLGGVTNFSYDSVGRLVARDLPNGVRTEYSYDLRDRISRIRHLDGATVIEDLQYTRNAVGAPTQVSLHSGQIVYSYDGAMRLTGETHSGGTSKAITYSYDASGKRTAKTVDGAATNYAYGDGYDLVQATGAEAGTYAWDEDGRMSSITRGGKTTALQHSALGTVERVTVDGDVTDYEHNGLGARMRATGAGGERRFVVGSSTGGTVRRPLAVVDGDGAVQASYVFVGHSPLMRIGSDGEPMYYLEDALGSVVALTADNGDTEARFHYDAFGNVIGGDAATAAAAAGAGGDFRFQGHWLESGSGIYHMQMRDYDPQTGLFLSRDPVAVDAMVPETHHHYAFARQVPTLYTDPTGGFGLISISISMDVQSMMSGAKTVAIQQAREFIIDQIKQFFFEHLLAMTVGALPGAAMIEEIIAKGGDAGKAFEEGLFGFVCQGFMQGTPLEYTHWFTILRNSDDQPNANPVVYDGLSCADKNNSKKRKDHDRLRASFNESDLIIGPNAPSSGGAWIVSDFKVSAKAIRKSREQFKSMARFARQNGNRLVGYIVWKGSEKLIDDIVGNRLAEVQVFRDAIVEGVAVVILDMTSKGSKHVKL